MSNIKFTGEILDNVHGFIPYTDAEKKIMDTLLFKRLQSIKQLSIANWVFPGSEHTRYIHSLGVMHIADKIAIKLDRSDGDRKILRLAALLHDIGHYPLSHLCEAPYKKTSALENIVDDVFFQSVNQNTKKAIEGFSIDTKTTLMSRSTGRHHEAIGSYIVQNNEEIRNIIIDECGVQAPEIIADIITGNVERQGTDPLLVQIIHSELDADGIDYLMRDATFSGTSFGSFELEQLIRCMEVGEYNGKPILCINPKGIAAADQYLINKFFSYSQVVYNKHIVILEWMAEQVVIWMQQHKAFFPDGSTLDAWVKSKDVSEKYLKFTDNLFWASLERIVTDDLSDLVPQYVKNFCKCLLHHSELPYVDGSEIRIVSNKVTDIQNALREAAVFQRPNSNNTVSLLSKRTMSNQVPHFLFLEAIYKKHANSEEKSVVDDDEEGIPAIDTDEMNTLETGRLMEGICVKEPTGELRLLCDDQRSMMQELYNTTFAVLRTYMVSSDSITSSTQAP